MLFLLYRVRVFDNAKKIHHVKHLFELLVNFTQIHIVLKVIPWDFVMKVSSNPWMLKSLLNGVPLTWLWVTKLFNEALSQFVKFPTVSQLFEVNCFSLVFDFVITFFPQWMLSSYHLIHNETSCPNIDSFSVELTTLHLLWCLIDQCTTSLIYTLPSLIFNGQTKINNLDSLKVSKILYYNIGWLNVSVNIIISMNLL